jgi:hypothetical protein
MRCRATMYYARVSLPPRPARRSGGGVAIAHDANASRTSISKVIPIGDTSLRALLVTLFPNVTAPASARLWRVG